MKRFLGFVCLLVAATASADTLFDVRTAVSHLTAKTPARATFTSQVNVKSSGRFANKAFTTTVSLEATHDANGISFTIPQSLIDQAAHESATHAAEAPAKATIDAMHPANVVEALDYRSEFLEMLEGAKVTAEKRVAFRGKPTRQLTLKLGPPKPRENSVSLGDSKSERTMNLWIGDDNIPLAGEMSTKTTTGFLMFHATSEERESFTLAHVSDRLVLARLETSGTGSGLGQNFAATTVQTLTLH